MQFIVEEKIESAKPGFYIDISFMSGDADHYDTETIGPITRDLLDEAYELVAFLDRLNEARCKWNGPVRRFDSMDVMPEGAKRFIYVEECDAEWEYVKTCNGECEECEYGKHQSPLSFEWPRDVLDLSYSYNAAFDGYKIYFIDQFGGKYDVSVDYEGV